MEDTIRKLTLRGVMVKFTATESPSGGAFSCTLQAPSKPAATAAGGSPSDALEGALVRAATS